ncbi:hypothetical protein BAC1_00015 [uncultured bacterium]|nr:hypothetical protein BAC1_00015 [uncultured bacterium]
MKKLWLAAVLLAPCLYYGNAYAQVNAGFEEGDTSGWTETYPSYDGRISVVTSWSNQGAQYAPVEGNYFAVVETGVYDGQFTTLSQKISLKGGDKLEGWAGFCCGSEVGFPYSGDNGDYNDYALINILNGYGNVISTPWYADSFDIGYGITTPDNQWTGEYVSFGPVQWEYWSWTAPGQDLYTLQYQTTQGGDSEGLSYAFFDGALNVTDGRTNAAVPEPSSFAMAGLAAGALFAARRYFRTYAGGDTA